jgi:hypothetical protein
VLPSVTPGAILIFMMFPLHLINHIRTTTRADVETIFAVAQCISPRV